MSIDKISGVEYDPESEDEIKNGNAEPLDDIVHDVSVATLEAIDDPMKNIIFNSLVP